MKDGTESGDEGTALFEADGVHHRCCLMPPGNRNLLGSTNAATYDLILSSCVMIR